MLYLTLLTLPITVCTFCVEANVLFRNISKFVSYKIHLSGTSHIDVSGVPAFSNEKNFTASTTHQTSTIITSTKGMYMRSQTHTDYMRNYNTEKIFTKFYCKKDSILTLL
jgi:hypothetical protein